ncbi:MAG: single-stranded DNA-binding protein [Epibacterium sp.]|nr:single-stranded DNA-binding protein [Epibacterium sp.]NQX73785.1 single-stranded DNA-binding protein [Epibacterium sp.]
MELNNVKMIGNLCRDPESKTTGTGQLVCKLTIASSRKAKGGKEETCFIDVEAWGKTAEICEKYLRKGSQVLVDGRLKLDQWTDKDGNKRSRHGIVADRISLGNRSEANSQGSAPPARAPQPTASVSTAGDDPDDLPF